MSRTFVVSIMAANRIGVLAAVTRAMASLGGNLIEASQTVVHNFFAIVLAGEFPDSVDAGLIDDHITDAGRGYGLVVTVKDPQLEEFSSAPTSDRELRRLVVSGQDRPGIMPEVSARLAQRSIDICGLYAVRDAESYRIEMQLFVPLDVDQPALCEELENLGHQIHWQ